MEYRVFQLDVKTWRIEEYDDHSSVYFYLLSGEKGALLLDTGMGTVDTAQIVRSLTNLPVTVLCTHGHFDHIGGNAYFDEVWMHRADEPLYRLHSSPEMGFLKQPPKENIHWFEGEPTFELGNRPLRVIHTPGHSLGSVCLLDVSRRWLFTGDTCCKADVLLNLEYSTCVSQYAQSIQKLLAMREAYDITWPDHHTVPVETGVLTQFAQAAERLCSGQAEGENFAFILGSAKRFVYQDIAIVYTPGNIHPLS